MVHIGPKLTTASALDGSCCPTYYLTQPTTHTIHVARCEGGWKFAWYRVQISNMTGFTYSSCSLHAFWLF